MADHTPPLESGQLLSPELPMLASPPPPAMVNGDGPQQLQGDCVSSWLVPPLAGFPCVIWLPFPVHPAASSHQRTVNN
ncbi:Fibronectin type-III domain containing protein 3a [Dissostichus eleginoides]|uniref:Fibronectin type-III domain containing protein 3a n=1 Tax=Dissostichus eleginoides TaxID=100907 RepID=A0AAD9CFI8_DISEL|nr:Fibronectin type-III domain containing protein 3a [Dissostichus eleginoides]